MRNWSSTYALGLGIKVKCADESQHSQYSVVVWWFYNGYSQTHGMGCCCGMVRLWLAAGAWTGNLKTVAHNAPMQACGKPATVLISVNNFNYSCHFRSKINRNFGSPQMHSLCKFGVNLSTDIAIIVWKPTILSDGQAGCTTCRAWLSP